MSSGEAMESASFACSAARCSGAREALVVVVLLYGLTQNAEALAGDATTNVVKDIQPIIGGTPLSLTFVPTRSVANEPQFSAEFSARKPSLLEARAPTENESSNRDQSLRSTSAWQRLADYRSHGRVQLLTLWESRSSSISLQAGHHGGPSLQWSSRVMNRGGATRGLLDRFFASSLGVSGVGSRLIPRSPNAPAANKPINLLPTTKSP